MSHPPTDTNTDVYVHTYLSPGDLRSRLYIVGCPLHAAPPPSAGLATWTSPSTLVLGLGRSGRHGGRARTISRPLQHWTTDAVVTDGGNRASVEAASYAAGWTLGTWLKVLDLPREVRPFRYVLLE